MCTRGDWGHQHLQLADSMFQTLHLTALASWLLGCPLLSNMPVSVSADHAQHAQSSSVKLDML